MTPSSQRDSGQRDSNTPFRMRLGRDGIPSISLTAVKFTLLVSAVLLVGWRANSWYTSLIAAIDRTTREVNRINENAWTVRDQRDYDAELQRLNASQSIKAPDSRIIHLQNSDEFKAGYSGDPDAPPASHG